MAFGGKPIFLHSTQWAPNWPPLNPNAPLFNYVRIDGLTMGSNPPKDPKEALQLTKDGSPSVDLTDPRIGQITTSATPGPNQVGLPNGFGRGPGKWLAEDVNLFENHFQLVGSPERNGFAVPALLLGSPEFVDGNIMMTYLNVVDGGDNDSAPVRIVLQWLHTIAS
jgi:hypothetical protein